MKKIVLVIIGILTIHTINAQPGKTVAKPAPLLKTNADSVSYILGEVAVFQMMQQGLGDLLGGTTINNAAFMQGLKDIIAKKKTLIDDVNANTILNNAMVKVKEKKAQTYIAAGAKFLAQNKLKPGVKTTASGLQYEVITEGTGIKPTLVDTFVANYRGTLLDGTEFDASANRGEPLTYPVAKVVPGWIEGLQLMSIGSKYKFYVPYNLGYGIMGSGDKIPGGSTLVFELELLEVKKKQ